MRTSYAEGPCERVSGSITLKGCDCDGVRAFPEEEGATNIPSTDDSADSVTLNREGGLVREGSYTYDICNLLLLFHIGGGILIWFLFVLREVSKTTS